MQTWWIFDSRIAYWEIDNIYIRPQDNPVGLVLRGFLRILRVAEVG